MLEMENHELLDVKQDKVNYHNIKEESDSVDDDEDCKDNNNNNKLKKTAQSACYKIIPNLHLMSDPIFYFMKGDKVIYTAIGKENVFYICEGKCEDNQEGDFKNIAKLTRNKDNYNIVNTGDQEIKIRYALYYPTYDYSIKISFDHQGKKLSWKPKTPKSPTSFNGEYNHTPIESEKNMILQNHSLDPTFILRAMSKETYEAECHQSVNPIVVFSIALSQIVGPLAYESTFSFI